MPRVKRGTMTHKRHHKILKEASGYFGGKSRLFKTANESVMKAGNYAYRDRRTKKRGYETSQRIRKKIEEIFGWMKTTGGLRKTRYRGVERTNACAQMVAASYNLLRLAKLAFKAAVASPPPQTAGA